MSWADDEGITWADGPEDVDAYESFEEKAKKDFVRQMGKRVNEMAQKLAKKEMEPGNHPFFKKELQEKYYFLHINAYDERLDVREIDDNYKENLYNWYKRRGTDENILFMRTLKGNVINWE